MQLQSPHTWRVVIPGTALTVGLAFVARFGSSEIAAYWMNGEASPISPVLLGIVLGILWRHFIGLSSKAERGVRWILGTILHIGIALVGLRLTLGGIATVGPGAFVVVVSCITTALLMSWTVCRILGLSSTMRAMLAVGSAVCGCTAIVAIAPAIRARPAEIGAALTCVVLIGSLGMLLYPWLAATLLHLQPRLVGIFLGSAIHDTSQVVGASLIYAQQFGAPDVIGFASATKLIRNLAIIFLVPLLAWNALRDSTDHGESASRKPLVPNFVIWFVALVLVRTLGDHWILGDTGAEYLWQRIMSTSQVVSDTFMTCGMTAVGLSVSLAQMHQTGFRPICAAVTIAASTALCSLGVINFVLS